MPILSYSHRRRKTPSLHKRSKRAKAARVDGKPEPNPPIVIARYEYPSEQSIQDQLNQEIFEEQRVANQPATKSALSRCLSFLAPVTAYIPPVEKFTAFAQHAGAQVLQGFISTFLPSAGLQLGLRKDKKFVDGLSVSFLENDDVPLRKDLVRPQDFANEPMDCHSEDEKLVKVYLMKPCAIDGLEEFMRPEEIVAKHKRVREILGKRKGRRALEKEIRNALKRLMGRT